VKGHKDWCENLITVRKSGSMTSPYICSCKITGEMLYDSLDRRKYAPTVNSPYFRLCTSNQGQSCGHNPPKKKKRGVFDSLLGR